jgi:manganese transport protein
MLNFLANRAKSETGSDPGATPSLPDAYRTVPIHNGSWLRKLLSFAGPAYLVSVGYMDPGNWATDLAGGSKYGYALLWVVLVSSLMAILLQTLCARLGLVMQRDLAQACRDFYKRPAVIALWILCEIAIIACDLAEVIGSAVALNLLFGLPLFWGVLITGVDVLILLTLMHVGFRKLEAVVITLVATIFGCFAIDIYMSKPDWPGVVHGLFVPGMPNYGDALVISLGILGATVMPHNLYLHSSVVQTRAHDRSPDGIKQAIRFNTIDTVVALGSAFFVNAAILVLAAAVFYEGAKYVERLQDAHTLLKPLLGGGAATAFAVALLASGQSSTITGTLAGQIVMEGFLRIRVKPWMRRFVTRSIAIIPAMILIGAKGGENTMSLLVFSQVVLSMQLSFAIFPLLMFTSDKKRMGEFVNPTWLKIVGYAVCLVIASLNLKLLYDEAAKRIGVAWFFFGLLGCVGFALWVQFGYKDKPKADNI